MTRDRRIRLFPGPRKPRERLPDRAEIAELMESAGKGGDIDAIRTTLEQSLTRTQRLERELRTALNQLKETEARRAAAEPYGDAWWAHHRREIEDALAREPADGIRLLVRAFADALIDGELDGCRRLADHAWPDPAPARPVLELLQAVRESLLDGPTVPAAHWLERLLRTHAGPGPRPVLDKAQRAALYVLAGRLLIDQDRFDAAQQRMLAAERLVPGSPLAQAGHADIDRARGDHDAALTGYQLALETAQPHPSAFIGLAQLAEERGESLEAMDWYAAAAKAASRAFKPEAALGALVARVPAEAYVQLALRLEEERPDDALRAADRALDMSWQAPSDAEARMNLIRAELLDAQKRKPEAARAYRDAGTRFTSDGRWDEAVVALQRALKLDEHIPDAAWHLAEALRMSSFAGRTEPDAEVLRTSIEVWDKAYEKAPPDYESGWSYIGRALASEELALQQDKWTGRWTAVGWFERGFTGGAIGNAARWTYLGRVFNQLSLVACALDATERAVSLPDADAIAWYWHAVALTNWGRVPEAADALERCRALDAELGIGFDAVIWAYQRRCADALEMMEKVLEGMPDDVIFRDFRAWTLIRCGDVAAAHDEYRAILDIPDPDGTTGPVPYARAAFELGDLDRTRALLEPLRDEPFEIEGEWRLLLAMCELAAGNLEQAHELVEVATRRFTPRELEGAEEDLERIAREWDLSDAQRQAVDEMHAEMRERRDGLEPRPEDELKCVLELSAERPLVGWAADATLARLARGRGAWREAVERSRRLGQREPHGPEPAQGVRAAMSELADDARECLRARQLQQAAARALEGRELIRPDDLDAPQLRVELAAIEACARLAASEPDAADRVLADAVADAEDPSVAVELVAACDDAAPDAALLWEVDGAFARLREAAADGGTRVWEEAQRALGDRAAVRLGLHANPSFPPDTRPTTELGHGLVPLDTGPDWSLFSEHLPAMRKRISESLGVEAEPLRFMNGPDLAPGGYRILIDGVTLASGEVPLQCRFAPVADEVLAGAGIGLDAVRQAAPDPVDGRMGAWLDEEAFERAEEHGIPLWPDIAYVVRHIEHVLRLHLARYLGLDEVEALLDEWSLSPALATLVEATLPEREQRLRFARLMRALAGEEVPLTRPRQILEAVARVGLEPARLGDALAAVRLDLLERLPGTEGNRQVVEIPVAWLAELTSLMDHGAVRVGTGKPAAAARLLALLDGTDAGPGCLLVAPDANARMLVRRLVADRIANVAVLAQDEWTAYEQGRERNPIAAAVEGSEHAV